MDREAGAEAKAHQVCLNSGLNCTIFLINYEFLTFCGWGDTLASMDDGHFLSFATVALGLVLILVLALGGLFIYLFLTQNKKSENAPDNKIV